MPAGAEFRNKPGRFGRICRVWVKSQESEDNLFEEHHFLALNKAAGFDLIEVYPAGN
jgi:hypothetical protein